MTAEKNGKGQEKSGPFKILIVDDEEIIRRVSERILRTEGYQTASAENGEEAAKLLHEGWDIVLSDISMPGAMNGNELVRCVRKETSADVILMTGAPELATAVQALRDGAYDYLMKPFNQDVIVAAVRRCAEKRRLSMELAREKTLRIQLEEAQHVKDIFGQFVTPEVAQFVLSQSESPWTNGTRQEVTMFFADVRGFTPFAESASPEEVVEVLNEILSLVINAVHREGGIVNKFMGDGLLALFGAPVPLENHAGAAARAALAAQKTVEAHFGAKPKGTAKILSLGIGINTGEVVAGCLGSKDRTEYSVIGHPVNLAARLEEAAAPNQILLGPETAELLKNDFRLKKTGPLTLYGISKPVIASELLEN